MRRSFAQNAGSDLHPQSADGTIGLLSGCFRLSYRFERRKGVVIRNRLRFRESNEARQTLGEGDGPLFLIQQASPPLNDIFTEANPS